MSLCPEAEMRAAMSDEEFWAHVFGQESDPRWDDEAYMPDPNDPTFVIVPCPVCGSHLSACGYDADGLPMIHVTEPEDA